MVTTINLRDMPETLVRRAKAHAALRGMSLKSFVIHAMEEAVTTLPEPAPPSHAPSGASAVPPPAVPPPEVLDRPSREPSTDSPRGKESKKDKKEKKKGKKHKKDKKHK
jgi:hypothetical protein